jgi:hypothetical protein
MIIYAILLMTLFMNTVEAREYCAFHVLVEDAHGQSNGVMVPVAVVDSAGRTVARVATHDGKADICDVGFGTFDIEVGPKSSCGQVLVRHLSIRLGVDMTVKAIFDPCAEPSWVGPTACLVLLRARSEDGQPLSHVPVDIDGHRTNLRTDSLGRVAIGMDFGQKSTFSLTTETKSANVTLSCARNDPWVERTLALHPK